MALRCAHPEVMADTGLCRWPSGKIAWRQNVSLTQLTDEIVERCYRRAWQGWAAVCGIEPTEVGLYAFANLLAVSASGPLEGFDANNAILALTQLPCGVGQNATLWQRINEHEAWDENFLYLVLLHELGHALGLPHSADPADIMYAYYNPDATGLSAGDAAQGVLRYGPATTPASDPGLPETQTFPVEVAADGTMLQFQLSIGFPQAGSYTVSVTCSKNP